MADTGCMKPLLRSLPTLISTMGLMLAPSASWGESQLTTQGTGASASLSFRIIIPPVIRVLENSHPAQLEALADGGWGAQQRLVVLSNMKRGFCVTLRQSEPSLQAWRLSAAQDPAVSVSPVADGYRLCTTRPGRYTLLLQHEFQSAGAEQLALRWPVQMDLTAM